MSTKPELYKSIVALGNTFTTILCDMYAARIEGVTLEMTKNVFVHPFVNEEGELVIWCNSQYFSAEFKHGSVPIFRNLGVCIEDYMEDVRGCFDEEDWNNNAHEIGTIPHRLKEINDLFVPLSAEERDLQFTYAKLVSQWFVILRWFEETELLGIDDDVMYVPAVTHAKDPADEVLTLDNNLIQLQLRPSAPPRFSTNPLPAIDYVEVALKDEDQPTAFYFIKQALDTIEDIDSMLWTNLK